jgi:hypothetical protein
MKLITTIILTTVTILLSFKVFSSKFSGKATSEYCGDDLGFE